jgi:hypothetical protein
MLQVNDPELDVHTNMLQVNNPEINVHTNMLQVNNPESQVQIKDVLKMECLNTD